MVRVLDFLVDLFWLRVPLLVRRVSGALGEILVDGQYLVAWRPLASAAPPIALLLGFWIGSTHWGYRAVFTESLTLMMLAVVVGVASTYLGALFVLGFALGDFLIMSTPGHMTARLSGLALHQPMVRLALLVEYGLLALLVVSVPLGAKALMAQLRLPRLVTRYTVGRYASVVIFAVGFPLLVGLATYLWQQSAPLLIRPVFTWGGGQPNATVMQPLQRTGLTLARMAALAALARVILEGFSLSTAGARERIQRLHTRLGEGAQRITPLMERVNPWVPSLLGAAWATFMLSGPVESPFWQYLLFGVLLLLAALRSGALPVPLGPWPRIAARIPLLLRMGATMAIVYIISQNVLLGRRPEGLGNLRVFVFITIVSLVVSYVFNPGLQEARGRRRKASQPAGEGAPAAPAAAPVSASSLLGLLLPALGAALLGALLFPELALADNCSGDSDCFGTARGMVAPAAATGAMALFLSGARRWVNRGVSLAMHMNPVTAPLAWGYGFVTGRDFWTGEATYFDLEWAKNVPEAFWEDYASGQALDRLATMLVNVPEGFKQGYEGTVKSLETAARFWSDVSGDPGKLADAMKELPGATAGAANDMMRMMRELEAAATAQDTTKFGEMMGKLTGNAMFQALLAKGQTAALQTAGRGVQALRGGRAAAAVDNVPVAPTPRPVTPSAPRPSPPAVRPSPAPAGGAGGTRPNLNQAGTYPTLNSPPTPPRPTVTPPRAPAPPTVSRPPTPATPRPVTPTAPAAPRPPIQQPPRPPAPPPAPRPAAAQPRPPAPTTRPPGTQSRPLAPAQRPPAPPPPPPPAPKPPTYRGTGELVGQLKKPTPSVNGAQMVNTGPPKQPLVQLAPENCGVVTAESIKASRGASVSPSQAGARQAAIDAGNFKPGQGMTAGDIANHINSGKDGLRAVAAPNQTVAHVRASIDTGNSVATLVKTPGGTNHWVHVQKVSSQNVTFLDPWNGRTWTAPIDNFGQSMIGPVVHVR